MKKIIALLGCLIFISSCREKPAQLSDEISVAQAQALIAGTPDLQIIDVRSPGEYKAGYIKGAKLIPSDEFEKRVSEISKDKPALLYCAGGGRSEIALDFLKKQGYSKAVHMGPGFSGWRQAGKAFEK